MHWKTSVYNMAEEWRRNGTYCHYCGRFIISVKVTVDHVIPKINGGSNSKDNCVPACRECNYIKGSRTKEEFLKYLQELNTYEKGVLFLKSLKVIANEIVPVYENETQDKLVNARDLHAGLGSKQQFADWIKDRIGKYGFNADIDYFINLGNRSDGKAGKPKTEYHLSLDMAKEIAMVENNEQGKKIRKYFIEVEKKAREMFQIPKSLPEALRLAAELAEKIEHDKPKVFFAEKCLKAGDSILIRELAKVAYGDGIEIGEHRLYKQLREWGLLRDNNEPYQKYIECGYFEVIQRLFNAGGTTKTARTTKVLPKGQEYIINRLGSASA